MELKDKNVVITGAAGGIGAAMCRLFAAQGAKLVVADLDGPAAAKLADEIGGVGVQCDVSDEQNIIDLVERAERAHGQVDLYISNAGFASGDVTHAASASNETWQRNWDVHVMSHVWAARALLPKMLERGDGYLLNIASAAGLLSQISDAAYTATKHAAVAFAESLAISHADQGIKVSVVCPQYVATNILGLMSDPKQAEKIPGVLSAEQCAAVILQGIEKEQFLILPHPEVGVFMERRGADVERWLGGMRRYRATLADESGNIDLSKIFAP